MPRPTLPPTPGSSSDIKGQDGLQQMTSLQLAFELPPPAIHDADAPHIPRAHGKLSPTSPSAGAPLRNIYPMQAAEAVKSRRRSSAATKDSRDISFALPPPPTRSRKIIQMKPRTQDNQETLASAKNGAGKASKDAAKTNGAASAAASASASAPASAHAGTNSPSKKKQPSATSAAGRKIARKTAHSLIERRRRSKMNEEFALLKSMIPACTGEMHKLAILQASIEYIRYLEDCVAKLKAQEVESSSSRSESHSLPSIREFHPCLRNEGPAEVEVTDSEAASPEYTHQKRPAPTALQSQDSHRRRYSYSPAPTDQRHYSYSNSTSTSPAFGPQQHVPGYSQEYTSGSSDSTLTSPALYPQSDPDQEATAALLMLNGGRRFTTTGMPSPAGANGNGRGLSVRDLLST